MKLRYTIAALAATTMLGNAAVIFDTLAGTDQANFTAGGTVATGAGQTFIANGLGADVYLSTIEVGNRNAGAAGTGLYLAVYEDSGNGADWNPGALVGVSTNTQDMTVNGGTATWTFSNETLTEGSRYLFTFTSDAAGTTTVAASTRVDLGSGNSDQSAFASGGAAFGGAHTMAAQIVTSNVPEPSSAALLGLGGLALIMRRRK